MRFPAVAGAFLFIFFSRFAMQHIGISETLNDRQFVQHFDDELEAFGVSESSSKSIDLSGEREIDFSCGNIGTGGYLKNFQKIVYAPLSLQGSTITAWTQQWNFPFPITNFFYLSNNRVRTVLIYDDSSVKFVQDLSVPSGFNFQAVHKKNLDLKQLGQYAYTLDAVNIISLSPVNNLQNILAAFPQKNVNVIEVDLQTHDIHYLNGHLDSFYLGDEMLYGVFFAPEQFDCLKGKALERLRNMASLLDQRARLLKGKTDDLTCGEKLFEASEIYKAFGKTDDKEELYAAMHAIEGIQDLLEKHNCFSAY